MTDSAIVLATGPAEKAPATNPGPQKRPSGSTSAAIMVLAAIMNTNRKQETGAADQMKVQDHLIIQYQKSLETIVDASGALGKGSINDEIQYTVLEADMDIITNKENGAQQNLEITSQLHLRDPSEANEAAANTGSSFDRLYQAYAKVR